MTLRLMAYTATYMDGDHQVVRTFYDTSTNLAELRFTAAMHYGVDPRTIDVRPF